MIVEAIFLKLLQMNAAASVLIVAVLLARFLLKRAPKWCLCLLWLMVGLRLVCPFSVESPMSLLPRQETVAQVGLQNIPSQLPDFTMPQEPSMLGKPVDAVPSTHQMQSEVSQKLSLLQVGTSLWLIGATVLMIYVVISYWRLKRRVRTATRMEGNVYESEYVDAPFVLGIIFPRIYLPYGLQMPHREHILAHERSHIRRLDHVIKPLSFCVLALHWFNPLVWVAYILLERDMEAACDERVIRAMTFEQRQSYSATLLRCSMHRRILGATPVAFGETGIKGRITNIMHYKKPTLWILLAAVVLCGALAVCFLTDPMQNEPSQPQLSEEPENGAQIEELIMQIVSKTDYDDLHPDYYRFIDPEARNALMEYGTEAVEYMRQQLHSTENYTHNFKEQIMVFLCADITRVAPVETRYDSAWWQDPGRWLTMYALSRTDTAGTSRTEPGFYGITDTLYGGPDDVIVPYELEKFFMVTDCGFFVYNEEAQYQTLQGEIRVRVRSEEYTTAFRVDWKWVLSDTETTIGEKLLSKNKEEWKIHAGLEELLGKKDYLYQQIDDRYILIQTGSGLYTDLYLIGYSEDTLNFVYELSEIS